MPRESSYACHSILMWNFQYKHTKIDRSESKATIFIKSHANFIELLWEQKVFLKSMSIYVDLTSASKHFSVNINNCCKVDLFEKRS